jgi:hypothetical protein
VQPKLRATVYRAGATFEIYAYRDLTDEEIELAIKRFKKPGPHWRRILAGKTYRVLTHYGLDDN